MAFRAIIHNHAFRYWKRQVFNSCTHFRSGPMDCLICISRVHVPPPCWFHFVQIVIFEVSDHLPCYVAVKMILRRYFSGIRSTNPSSLQRFASILKYCKFQRFLVRIQIDRLSALPTLIAPSIVLFRFNLYVLLHFKIQAYFAGRSTAAFSTKVASPTKTLNSGGRCCSWTFSG